MWCRLSSARPAGGSLQVSRCFYTCRQKNRQPLGGGARLIAHPEKDRRREADQRVYHRAALLLERVLDHAEGQLELREILPLQASRDVLLGHAVRCRGRDNARRGEVAWAMKASGDVAAKNMSILQVGAARKTRWH